MVESSSVGTWNIACPLLNVVWFCFDLTPFCFILSFSCLILLYDLSTLFWSAPNPITLSLFPRPTPTNPITFCACCILQLPRAHSSPSLLAFYPPLFTPLSFVLHESYCFASACDCFPILLCLPYNNARLPRTENLVHFLLGRSRINPDRTDISGSPHSRRGISFVLPAVLLVKVALSSPHESSSLPEPPMTGGCGQVPSRPFCLITWYRDTLLPLR